MQKNKAMNKILSYFFVLLCALFSFVTHGQINVKDSLQSILQNDTVEAETRFRNAYNLMFYNSSPEEAEALSTNVVYPFVQKTWKSESEQLAHLARLQILVCFCHRERGGSDRDEKERFFAEKALQTAIKSGDNTICARCYNVCGNMEFKRGDVKLAHEYLYQSIIYYDKMEMYVKSSEILYYIASTFFDTKDTEGMKRVLQQMSEYLERDPSKQSLYQYNVIKHNYLKTLLEKEQADNGTVDYGLADSMIVYIKKNIDIVENFLGELSPFWMHAYAYYFLAKELDAYYPEQTDSIFFYLDKAIELFEKETFVQKQEANVVMEFQIFINTVRAKTLFREGKIHEAHKAMSDAILLLDELKNYKNIILHRSEAYQFMVDYYEKTNNIAEALKYRKLLAENEAQRYEHEKLQAITGMSIKYETEKKEIQIQTLTKEKQTAQRVLWLTAGLISVLLISLLLLIHFYKLRKKNLEQSIYEAALLAELKQNELEQNLKEKEHLQQQYNELKTETNQNKQKAEAYNEELTRIKQQLAQKPTKTMIEKLTEWISKSIMEKTKKNAYIQQLSELDIDMLEQGYLTADEKISNMDMKYIICFAIDMNTKDMSILFNVEPTSIRTVRYRIKKKFKDKNTFKFLM